MGSLLGVLFHIIGGTASGSFYLPYKKVKNWAWESYWLAGGLFSWLIVPLIAAWLTVPNFIDIITSTDSSTLFYTYLMGLLWGIGGLTFGLSMRYLGMSLGMSVALGFCSAFGALVPSVYYNLYPQEGKISFSTLVSNNGGLIVLLSVAICLLGIAICGKAGMNKEKELTDEQKTEGVKEFNLSKGLIVATISGILSACFSFGIEAGKPMADVATKMAEASGSTTLFVNNVVFVVILLGGLTTNFIWCVFLNIKNKSYKNYTDAKTPLTSNYLFAAIAGTTWFLQFFFYGMGETKLGNGASSWILHMASIIIVSNLWGIKFNEWKGVSKKTFNKLLLGVAVIIISVVFCGLGNKKMSEILDATKKQQETTQIK
jgi:L-rhamnose-H+ transport protein